MSVCVEGEIEGDEKRAQRREGEHGDKDECVNANSCTDIHNSVLNAWLAK